MAPKKAPKKANSPATRTPGAIQPTMDKNPRLTHARYKPPMSRTRGHETPSDLAHMDRKPAAFHHTLSHEPKQARLPAPYPRACTRGNDQERALLPHGHPCQPRHQEPAHRESRPQRIAHSRSPQPRLPTPQAHREARRHSDTKPSNHHTRTRSKVSRPSTQAAISTLTQDDA